MRTRQKGFSLVELLIAMAIVLIISAIAVPNLLTARMAANEASAVSSLRTINGSAVTYSLTYPDSGFPPSLAVMGGAQPCTATPESACLLDETLASGLKSGYSFVWSSDGNTPSVEYTITANPVAVGSTGLGAYCSDQSDTIFNAPSGSGCTSASAILQ
jgi:type IV pilus assembly protein PilA